MIKTPWYTPGQEPPEPIKDYMELKQGTNHIRILTSPITGFEDWWPSVKGEKRKVARYRSGQQPARSATPGEKMKVFLTFVVWDYAAKAIKILHITQATIRSKLDLLCADPDWGNPCGYDIKIHRTGEMKDTEYEVTASPHSDLKPEIAQAFRAKPIWLEALYAGADPFGPSDDGYVTPLFSDQPQQTSSDSMDIELFMDFMPANATRETVEEFGRLCAQKVGVPFDQWLRETAGSDQSIERFISTYNRWVLKRNEPKPKSA
jgi:hypothetical protein